MDPSFVHFGHALDRPGQFALKCLQQLDAVLKLGGAEFTLIKYFKSLVATRQALPGQLKPCLVNVFLLHGNRGSIIDDLKGYFHFLQLCRHVTGIFAFHLSKQRYVLWLATHPITGGQYRNKQKQRRAHNEPALSG